MAFPIICPSCGKAFQLAAEIYDKKVAGKVVSIKCKQCLRGIRVDATEVGTLKVLGAAPLATKQQSAVPRMVSQPNDERTKSMPTVKGPPAAGAPAESPPVRARQPTLIGIMGPS